MIVIAFGANLGDPAQNVTNAFAELERRGVRIVKRSRLLRTKPFGVVGQPDFINAVAVVETHHPPEALLRLLHMVERAAGRRRGRRWGPRTLDLDIVDYRGRVLATPHLVLPHPGIAARSFVLEPLAEIAPRWRHPVTRKTAAEMLKPLFTRRA
jgi:2-amino-4-hydroxy-6-hydroxymethyldihydropteridine diphosphokinase